MSKVEIGNLCCILNPCSQCVHCDEVACADCDVWTTEECPSGKEIGDRHYLRYPRERGRIILHD